VYEIKVVSSVTNKDGFTQHGTSQRVVTGHSATGVPKYKTVTNKFAVLDMFLVTDKGTRSKIRSVVLGPTDAIKFNPTGNDLATVQNTLKSSVHTTDVADIQKIVTSSPLAVAPTSTATPVVVTPDPLATVYTPVQDFKDAGWMFTSFPFNGSTAYEVLPATAGNVFEHTVVTRQQLIDGLTAKKTIPNGDNGTRNDQLLADVLAGKYDGGSGYTYVNGVPYTVAAAQEAARNKELAAQGYLREIKVGNGVGYVPTGKTPSSSSSNSATDSATTLYEYYSALGQAIPSIAERAKMYESFGLGQATYYTGTAEQNTKLLSKLQGKA
jgi:hypothetical protein